jgi:hypothetical protein
VPKVIGSADFAGGCETRFGTASCASHGVLHVEQQLCQLH